MWPGACLGDQNRTNDEFGASLKGALRVLDIHHGAAANQNFAIIFLPEVAHTICPRNVCFQNVEYAF